MLNKNLITALFLCLSIAVSAQETNKNVLTLEKSIEVALANNKSILIAKEKLTKAKGKITEAKSGFLPSLTLQVSYTKLSLVPSFTLSLPVGPAVITREMKLGAEDNYMVKAILQETLFAWGRVSNSYTLSKHNLQAAEQAYKLAVDETIYKVTRTFYGAILAKSVYEANEEMLEKSQEHLKVVKSKFNSGNASQFEVLRARVQVENTKPLASKSKNSHETVLISLRNLLGIKQAQLIEVQGELIFIKDEITLEKALEDAFTNRPELKQAELRKQISEKSLSMAKAGNKPSLIAVANYNYQNPFYYTLDWVNNWSAGVVLNYPIFDGFATSGRAGQASSDLEQAEIQELQLKDGIEVEVRQLMLALNEAQERIVSQEENVKQAQESMRIAEVGYANGVVTNLEVMDTQLALTQAKTNYLQALYDYLTTSAGLKKATGSTGCSSQMQ